MESENQAVPGSSHSIDDDDSMNSNSKEMFMAKFGDDEFYEARDNLEFGVGEDEQAEEDEEDYYDVSPVEVLAHIVTTETTRVLTDEINGGFQNFIQQRRQELDTELRELAARPQAQNNPNRANLERLFNATSAQTSQENESNVDNPSEYRSETVRSELEELGQLSRVSSVLTTAGSRIEQTLRNLIGTRSNSSSISNNSQQVVTRPATEPQQQQQHEPPLIDPNDEPPVTMRPVSIEEISREQIVDEISVLVHRQLVSSTLRSDFRSTLERRVMDRMRQIGVENGEETRQLVLNLSREHGVRRNDFSGLGLNNNETSEVTNRQPTTSHHSREIRELKNEVTELKRMLKLSFEVQLDMQRSLKQEIAALIAGTWSQSASASLVSKTRPSSEGSCVICTESSVDAVFYQCGHMCACYACAQTLLDRQHNCPVCRAPIKDILRAYKVGLD